LLLLFCPAAIRFFCSAINSWMSRRSQPSQPASQPAGRGEEAAVCNRELLPDLVHKPSFKSVFSCSRGKRTTSLQLAPLSPFSFSSLIFLTGGSQSIYRNFDPLTSETAIASKQGTENPCGGSHWGEVGVCAESGEKHPVC
jgi:hypothetical protein